MGVFTDVWLNNFDHFSDGLRPLCGTALTVWGVLTVPPSLNCT